MMVFGPSYKESKVWTVDTIMEVLLPKREVFLFYDAFAIKFFFFFYITLLSLPTLLSRTTTIGFKTIILKSKSAKS